MGVEDREGFCRFEKVFGRRGRLLIHRVAGLCSLFRWLLISFGTWMEWTLRVLDCCCGGKEGSGIMVLV